MGAQSALILLLSLTWRESTRCNGLTVDPPDHLVAVDPGHLGLLEITWSPPASWIDVPDCQKLYQLEYFNTYEHSWTAIRTPRESYRAQFDLMKDIRVRVYTLLRGPCTNGTTVKSMNYTELVQKPPSAGVAGTAVKDFVCVYHNMEYMECNWKRSPRIPANSQQRLYFWHKDLEQTEECPKYILSGGVRSGCNFTGRTLPDFTDINFCINGSSAKGLLEPAFTTLQIQNQVKPGTTEKLHLQSRPDGQLEARWERPVGKVPGHCLEWEVEHSQESPDGKITSEQILTEQMNLTLSGTLGNERHCFRVRSKLHKYCVDRAIWSEWSRPTCYPVQSHINKAS
ncbi:interleukin-13 receptor subunit alpha-2 isoform X2 [Echeneis naucrates]|uniref:interleukin-13 receptor subunit alpha-2 isoform X2 n=1 Tax=Echeneis naucrates TaxID=173247 RepID=UPI001113CE8A|nr:interleukin-13 receptor subunit alpha-2-like isoform X2 [Echeneis naucrates]